MKKYFVFTILQIAIYLLFIIGEIMCIYKAVKCNWEPVGKAEIVYTVASFTGAGAIVGWFDIQDK